MKRIIIILFFLFLTIQPSGALTLEGGVTYTVETARAAAFDGVETKIDMSPYKEYLKDLYTLTNQSCIERGIYYLDASYGEPRRLGGFYTFGILTTYAIVYKREPYHTYYYSRDGTLLRIDIITKKTQKYPIKEAAYTPTGELKAVIFHVSDQEGYSFDRDGKFLGHWIGDYRYTEKGRKIPWSKRKSLN